MRKNTKEENIINMQMYKVLESLQKCDKHNDIIDLYIATEFNKRFLKKLNKKEGILL